MNFICFDIGGTNTKLAIINDSYEFLYKSSIPTNAHLGGEYILNNLIKYIGDLKATYPVNGVCISTTGVVDHLNGRIVYANDIIPNYTNMELANIVINKTKLQTSVENDVNCFALSHTLNNKADFLMLTVGTGIGGAIVFNQQVYHGQNNSAGEFGQMIIGNQNFEKQASITALINKAKELGLTVNNGEEIFNLYDLNNSKAKIAVDYFYTNLAIGILNLGYIFNIPKIIIGGGITNRKTMINELTEKINLLQDNAYFKSIIEISKNTNDGGLIGALVHHKKLYNI